MTMTSADLNGRGRDEGGADPAPRPKRGSFDAVCKAGILAEYDALGHGSLDRGALLRREGLYSSHLAE